MSDKTKQPTKRKGFRRRLKEAGWYVETIVDLLTIVVIGVITIIILSLVSDTNSFFKEEVNRWLITTIGSLTVTACVFYLAIKRFKIADDQLTTSKEQLETLSKKNDLDLYQAGLKALGKDDVESQLSGVRVLAKLFEGEVAEEVKSFLKHLLVKHGGQRFKWKKSDTAQEQKERTGIYSETRDEIIRILCQKKEAIDLIGLNLIGARLAKVDLRTTGFIYANLSEAYLYKANLAGVYLGRTNLEGTELGGADLTGAHLVSANLRGASLFNANLKDADLSDACLEGAELGSADLSGANLNGANLSETKLSKAENLASVKSFKGIWAIKNREPDGFNSFPVAFKKELEANLRSLDSDFP